MGWLKLILAFGCNFPRILTKKLTMEKHIAEKKVENDNWQRHVEGRRRQRKVHKATMCRVIECREERRYRMRLQRPNAMAFHCAPRRDTFPRMGAITCSF